MSKSKEEIWLKHNNGCTCDIAYSSRKLVAPDCCFHNTEFEPPMDEYAKQQSIAFVKWKDGRGYLPFQKPDSTTPEWGWKRQENQIIWSKWINDDQLYDLFIQHQSQQP